MSDPGARQAARAIDALRRGWPFRVEGNGGTLDLLAVESARDDALAVFASHDLLLSGERAVTLMLTGKAVVLETDGSFSVVSSGEGPVIGSLRYVRRRPSDGGAIG